MGFRTLSVAPTTIPTTKAAVRKVDISELARTTIDRSRRL
jgi:phosphoenolpyruvate-protein kinase (PTS system EI component)